VVAFLYALIEVYYMPIGQGNIISFYHLIVFLIGFFVGLTKTLVFSVLEDTFYLVLKRQLFFFWSSGYIVVYHVPIYYIPFLLTAIYLYKKSG